MSSWLAWLIAGVSSAICLLLWFRDVRRIMRDRMGTVKSAAGQLTICRDRAIRSRGDPEVAAVLERSRKIYEQAVDLYNRTLRKPWICIPAHLLGYTSVREDTEFSEGANRPDASHSQWRCEPFSHSNWGGRA